MNYEKRIAFLKEWFKSDVLTRFNMPRDLDPKVVAMDLIEAINSNLPSKVDEQLISEISQYVIKEVSQSARSRTLPPAKEFIDAIRKASQSRGAPRSVGSSNDFNPYAVAAKRIRSGEPVSETYLKGPSRKRLQETQGITDLDLEPYLKRLHNTAHKQ